jgi:hypothetical protein
MNGLEPVELEPESTLGRLMGRRNTENAYRQVNNLVAGSPIFQIYHDGVLAVLRSYGLDFEVARPRLVELYTRVLRHYAKEGRLEGLDAEHVERLGELFGFSHEMMAKLNGEELAKLAK